MGTERNTVTINTDASYCPDTGAAGYAFWISTESGRYKKHGVLKDAKNSIEAEMHAVANALHFLFTNPPTHGMTFDKIWINSDCTTVLDRVEKGAEDTKAEQFIQMKIALLLDDCGDLICRHVKAHQHKRTPRNFVNFWCDCYAKKSMKERREEIRSIRK
jgi:ribonuclease HI